MSSLLALTMRMGISSCSRSLRQIVFVSVDVNGIFSFGEENKILLWGQEGNQPPAGEIFRMFQIAVKKIWQEISAACVHLDIFSRYR